MVTASGQCTTKEATMPVETNDLLLPDWVSIIKQRSKEKAIGVFFYSTELRDEVDVSTGSQG